MPLIVLFASMLVLMFLRVRLPVGAKLQGKVAKDLALSFPERSLMQRVNIYCLGFVLLMTVVSGLVYGPAELLVIFAALVIMLMPVHCYITSSGVGISNVVFRPWNELSGYSVEKRRIVLHGREGMRPLNLPLLGRHQEEALSVLRRHLKEVRVAKNVTAHKSLKAV